MKKLSYTEFKDAMKKHHDTGKKPIIGVIVFTEESFDKTHPIESRSYIVSSNNKAFGNCCGYSIFGSSLDGTDISIRLDAYMKAEKGGKDGWIVDYCYFLEK